jgi:hypothetical protein
MKNDHKKSLVELNLRFLLQNLPSVEINLNFYTYVTAMSDCFDKCHFKICDDVFLGFTFLLLISVYARCSDLRLMKKMLLLFRYSCRRAEN